MTTPCHHSKCSSRVVRKNTKHNVKTSANSRSGSQNVLLAEQLTAATEMSSDAGLHTAHYQSTNHNHENHTNLQVLATIKELCLHIDQLEISVNNLTDKVNKLSINPSKLLLTSTSTQTSDYPLPSSPSSKVTPQNAFNSPRSPSTSSPSAPKIHPSFSDMASKTPSKCVTNNSTHPNPAQIKNHSSKKSPRPRNLNNNFNRPSASNYTSPTSSSVNSLKPNSSNNNLSNSNKISSTEASSSRSNNNPRLVHTPDSMKKHKPTTSSSTSSWFNIAGDPIPNTKAPIFIRTSEVSSTTSKPENLPNVWLIHDELLDDIDSKRLGDSYSCNITPLQANHPNKITQVTLQAHSDLDFESKPDLISIQTGINGIQSSDAFITAKVVLDSADSIHKQLPTSKILINKLIPTRSKSLNVHAKLYNALIEEASETKDYLSVSNHRFLATKATIRNTLYPTARGTNILASTLGKAIINNLWTLQKSKK